MTTGGEKKTQHNKTKQTRDDENIDLQSLPQQKQSPRQDTNRLWLLLLSDTAITASVTPLPSGLWHTTSHRQLLPLRLKRTKEL